MSKGHKIDAGRPGVELKGLWFGLQGEDFGSRVCGLKVESLMLRLVMSGFRRSSQHTRT